MRLKILQAVMLMVCLNGCKSADKPIEREEIHESAIIRIIPKRYDFGEASAKKSTKIPFSFLIENVAQDTLRISKVDASCGCVHISTYPDEIVPGENGKIVGVIDIEGQNGYLNKAIFISYNGDEISLVRVVGEVVE